MGEKNNFVFPAAPHKAEASKSRNAHSWKLEQEGQRLLKGPRSYHERNLASVFWASQARPKYHPTQVLSLSVWARGRNRKTGNTHKHVAARAQFSFSFFPDSTISARWCALEFLIKSAYNGTRLWAHVYCVHLMFLCIINKRSRPVSKNAKRFLPGPRRIAMLSESKKCARGDLQRLRRPHTSSAAPQHQRIGAARFLYTRFSLEEYTNKATKSAFRFLSSLLHTIATNNRRKHLRWRREQPKPYNEPKKAYISNVRDFFRLHSLTALN